MKTLKMIAIALMATIAFTACSDDENEGTNLPGIFAGKRLVKVEDLNTSIKCGMEFTYADGKLVGCSDYEIYQGEKDITTYKITYSGNTVTISNQSKSGGEKEETVYTLNADGYAVSAIYTDVEEDEDELDTYTEHCTFQYADGYLIKIVSDDETTTINYQDGDVVSYSQFGQTYSCAASNILNTGGILPAYGWLDDAAAAELEIAHYAGILGKHTKHLLAKEGSYNYKYEMDGEYVKTGTAVSPAGHEDVSSYSFK